MRRAVENGEDDGGRAEDAGEVGEVGFRARRAGDLPDWGRASSSHGRLHKAGSLRAATITWLSVRGQWANTERDQGDRPPQAVRKGRGAEGRRPARAGRHRLRAPRPNGHRDERTSDLHHPARRTANHQVAGSTSSRTRRGAQAVGLTGRNAGSHEPDRGREPQAGRAPVPRLGDAAPSTPARVPAPQVFELTAPAEQLPAHVAPEACITASTSPRARRRAPCLFLDEPTTGLDPRSRLALSDSLQHLVAGGTTVLLTTRDLSTKPIAWPSDIASSIPASCRRQGASRRATRSVSASERLEMILADSAAAERAIAALRAVADSEPTVEDSRISISRARGAAA